jgi:hypothetical protein
MKARQGSEGGPQYAALTVTNVRLLTFEPELKVTVHRELRSTQKESSLPNPGRGRL